MITTSSEKLQRDLHWTATAPVIMSAKTSPCFVESAIPEGITSLPDFNHESLQNLQHKLQQSSSRYLGHYYEKLCQYLMTALEHVELITCNQQIKQGKITIGEIDQLYCNKSLNKFVHREIAVKFYLGVPDTDGKTTLSHWIGPNTNDRLDKKIDRLFTHQLLMPGTAAGLEVLAQLGVNDKVDSEVLLQGRLFYAFDRPCSPPPGVNDKHQQGIWLEQRQLDDWLDTLDSSVYFNQLNKLNWLVAKPMSSDAADVIHTTQLKAHCQQQFKNQTRPVMMSVLVVENSDVTEIQRAFIVPDTWLEKAHACIP